MTTAGAAVSIAPGSLRAWLAASRPATLGAAVTPVVVGTACACAAGRFAPMPALAALLGALFIQVGTNLANDVYDHEKGADAADRLGPARAAQVGLLSAGALRGGMTVCFALATLVGVYLAWVAGPVVVVVGLLSIASGIAYTAGPFPLGYHGLGDLFVMVFFGFVAVCATAFVQVGAVPPLALAASLPVGCVATCVLVVNNLRDRVTDARAGKRTLAVRLGRRGAIAEYAVLLLLAYGTPVALRVSERCDSWVLLPLVTLPLAVGLARDVATLRGRSLNATLVGTARLLVAHGTLLAAGIALGAPASP